MFSKLNLLEVTILDAHYKNSSLHLRIIIEIQSNIYLFRVFFNLKAMHNYSRKSCVITEATFYMRLHALYKWHVKGLLG